MLNVLLTALTDFGIYSLFVVLYTVVGAYQNINVFEQKFDWRKYVNGLVKWLALGGVVVGLAVGTYLLIAQSAAQGVQLQNVEAIAPRVIFALMLLASGVIAGKTIAKLGIKVGLTEDQVKAIQDQAVNTDTDKPLVLKIDGIPMPSEEYLKQKIADEQEGGVGTFYSVPIGSYEAFKSAVNGRGFDIDNYYGWQCWDGAALLWQQLGLSLVTGNGLAVGTWDLNKDRNKYDKFDLVHDVNSLKPGDVVVMRPNHIGFFDGYDGNYMRILGQNQGGAVGANGGAAFNITRVAKSAFAGAFRYKGWVNNTPAPAPQPVPTTPARKSNEEIAREVARGDWGNNPERKNRLVAAGYDYDVIQAIVNAGVPAPKPNTAAIKQGDTVVPINRISYDGVPLTQYDPTYTVSEVKGDRAVLVARGQVWAAINIANIRKA